MGALFCWLFNYLLAYVFDRHKTACSVLREALQYTHAANKAAQGERIGGHHETGSLTITFLRINWCQVVTSWQLLNE